MMIAWQKVVDGKTVGKNQKTDFMIFSQSRYFSLTIDFFIGIILSKVWRVVFNDAGRLVDKKVQ